MVQIELQPLPPATPPATLCTNSYDDLRQAAPVDRSGTTSPDRLSLNPGSQLSRVDGGRDAWVFLAAATAIEVLVWGLPFSVGVLHSYWTTELFKDDHSAESTLTLAATLQTGLMYLSCVFFGPLLARFPSYRLHMQLFGLSAAVAGIIGSAFATKPSHLLVCLGLIYPFSCVYYLPCAVLLFDWFSKKRGLASGVLYAGTGCGGTVFPFIMSALLRRFSYRTSMIALGIGYGLIGGVAVCGIKPRIPIAKSSVNVVRRRTRINWSFLRRSPIYCFVATILLTSLGNFVPTVWLASYASEIKSKPDGATLVALMNAASVPGLLLFGWLSDRLPTRIVIALTAGGAALASIFLWGFAGQSSALLIVFTLVFGLTGLAFTSLWSKLITIVSHDDPNLPSLIFSFFAFARGVGNIASGPIATSLLKSDLFRGGAGSYGLHNYGSLLLFSGVMQVAGSICGVTYRHKKA